MNLEEELRYLKAQIHEIEEKLRYSNSEQEYDYESDLIDKVYEICHDDNETGSFLAKVMEVCSLDNYALNTTIKLNSPIGTNSPIMKQSAKENQRPVQVSQPSQDLFLPKIIDYSLISEVEDTFMERNIERIQAKYLPPEYKSKPNYPETFVDKGIDGNDMILDIDRIRKLKKI